MFEQQFPQYLAMGMPSREYWEEDCWRVRAYREADRIRMQRVNEQAWLQGAYIYDVMTRLYSIYNPFSKHPKAQPYPGSPYDFSGKAEREKEEDMTEEELQQKVDESRDAFMAMMLRKNKERAEGGEGDGGGGGQQT